MFFNLDLVSRGQYECWGTYDNVTKIGWGGGYKNNCIHSGTIRASGDLPTTWYNYTLATAGTIISENTDAENPANNTTKATESVCPKGWTLPGNAQINTNRSISNFSPVLGGNYSNGNFYNESTLGDWWGSEAYNGVRRYLLRYNGSLFTYYYFRSQGFYIRCVPAP